MGYFLTYILKSAVCLALLYLPFRLWLRKETFFRINRLGLLGITVLAFLLPLLNFPGLVKETYVSFPEVTIVGYADETTEAVQPSIGWSFVMLVIYVLGGIYFLIHKLREWIRLDRFIRQGCLWTSHENGIHIHCHACPVSPFSWLNRIVISEKDYQENGRVILMHETAHIRCRHSWDMIGLSMVEIVQWFNPAVWMLTKDMQDIHEYEADHWVIENGIDAKTYQLSIIKKAIDINLCSLANSFNRSSVTKRMDMMLKKASRPKACMKYLYVFPLATLSLVVLSDPGVSNRLNEISTVDPGQLVSLIVPDEEDVLEYSFLDSRGLPNTVVMRREGNTASKLVDSVKVVVDEVKVGYGQEALKRIPGEQIKSVLAIPDEATIKITTKKEKLRSMSLVGYLENKAASKVPESLSETPLVVVDGKIVNPDILKTMGPDDIESMSVAKNQQILEQLYGDKAKHGVILITTKKSIK